MDMFDFSPNYIENLMDCLIKRFTYGRRYFANWCSSLWLFNDVFPDLKILHKRILQPIWRQIRALKRRNGYIKFIGFIKNIFETKATDKRNEKLMRKLIEQTQN